MGYDPATRKRFERKIVEAPSSRALHTELMKSNDGSTRSAGSAADTPHAPSDPEWAAILHRDVEAAFVYAVRTTGVFCLPRCPSRRPRRENVRTFATAEHAGRAGFRACLRCRPTDARPSFVVDACRLLDADDSLRLDVLAARVGKSPFHLQRAFKAALGVSPHAYAKARRLARAHGAIERAPSITAAAYDAGYPASSSFYADVASGLSPRARRARGEGHEVRVALGECALGAIAVAATERGVCAVELGDDPDVLVRAVVASFPKARWVTDDDRLDGWVACVVGAIDEPARARALPLDVRGTAFRQRVWEALRTIPRGEVTTYAELARRIERPTAVRAVASACANNPLAIVIPCHRVIRSDGALAGYRWGVDRKRALLLREGTRAGLARG